MSTNDQQSDHDLKAYLDGRDGVSAAYRKSAHEEPPRALDQAILAAARNQVRQGQPSPRAWYGQRGPYALAASVMLAVLVVSLYFNALDDVVVPSIRDEAPVATLELQPVEDAAEAVANEKADAAPAASPRAEDVVTPQFVTRRLAPAVPAVGAADSVAAPAAPAAELSRDALARGAEPPAVVIDGPLLEEIEAEAAGAQVTRQGAAALAPQGQEEELEEIMVTGSRIMRRDEGDVSYRDSREDWLQEISVLAEEFAARSRLTTARAAAARIEEQLNEEIDLYLEAYPDADIEAELEALEE